MPPIEDEVPEELGVKVEEPASGVRVVRVDGELDMLTAPVLRTALLEQLAAAPGHLVLDLSDVRFLGSNGLAVLVETRSAAGEAHIALHLTGTDHPWVARPLEVSGLLGLFDRHPSPEAWLDGPGRAIRANPCDGT